MLAVANGGRRRRRAAARPRRSCARALAAAANSAAAADRELHASSRAHTTVPFRPRVTTRRRPPIPCRRGPRCGARRPVRRPGSARQGAWYRRQGALVGPFNDVQPELFEQRDGAGRDWAARRRETLPPLCLAGVHCPGSWERPALFAAGELRLVEFRVKPARGHQLLMGALFNDPSMVHDEN